MTIRLPVNGFLLVAVVLMVGCGFSDSNQDLRDFIAENKRRPPGRIKEPPKIEPYEFFLYDAYRLRSPFDQPISAVAEDGSPSLNSVQPDFSRQKERLEQFDLSTLSMVGSVSREGVLWALVDDPEGAVEKVKIGNYIGRNHGKIIGLSASKIDLLEIVASGDGWLERPNVLELKRVSTE